MRGTSLLVIVARRLGMRCRGSRLVVLAALMFSAPAIARQDAVTLPVKRIPVVGVTYRIDFHASRVAKAFAEQGGQRQPVGKEQTSTSALRGQIVWDQIDLLSQRIAATITIDDLAIAQNASWSRPLPAGSIVKCLVEQGELSATCEGSPVADQVRELLDQFIPNDMESIDPSVPEAEDPGRAVRAGEQWPLDAGRLLRELGGNKEFKLDGATVSGVVIFKEQVAGPPARFVLEERMTVENLEMAVTHGPVTKGTLSARQVTTAPLDPSQPGEETRMTGELSLRQVDGAAGMMLQITLVTEMTHIPVVGGKPAWTPKLKVKRAPKG